MDWLALITTLIRRAPVEKFLIPRPDKAKDTEEFLGSLKTLETKKETASAPAATIPSETAGEVALSGSTGVLTRPGVDAGRMAWQNSIIRGELWLLEGHLKNNCLGCGGDVECCFKHCQNVIDAARETQSMTTDPLYQEAVSAAEQVQPYVHPEDIKAGKYLSKYPTLAIEVSKVRTQFDKRVMEHARPPLTLEEAQKLAAEEAAKEVERKWHSQETK